MSKLFTTFLICSFVFFSNSNAKETNRYSVITLKNETPFRIYYSYAWEKGEKEWRNSIKPYGTYVHWWTFKHPNQNWAPWFYLHTDDAGPDEWYRLGSFFSPNKQSENGRTYIFSSIHEGDNVWKIELHEKLYTD